MSTQSKIEWCDTTWNPIVGCSKVSAGCANCYAIRQAHRMAGNPNPKIAAANAGLTELRGGHVQWTGRVNLLPERLAQPMHWRKPRRVFVNSLSDLFHEGVPDGFIDQVFAVMALCPQHTFMVLTKRPERMWEWFDYDAAYRTRACRISEACADHFGLDPHADDPTDPWPLPNVWLGVSVEDQATADARVPILLDTPAAVRWVSYEPALGPVNFTAIQPDPNMGYFYSALMDQRDGTEGSPGTPPLDWIVSGGESGPGARPAHPGWFRQVRDQCAAAGVAYFHKQNGAFIPMGDWVRLSLHPALLGPVPIVNGLRMARVGKKAAGRLLDGREHNEFPACPPA